MMFDDFTPDQAEAALAYDRRTLDEASVIPGVSHDATRPVERAAVVGAGTMGCGIAMAFANAGIATVLIDSSPAALERGLQRIRKDYEVSQARGRLGAGDVDARLALIQPRPDIADAGDADIVIEAVIEDLDVKRALFAAIDAVAKPGAILGTNTSALDINLIAQATRRAHDVVGVHFFAPAHVMRLLEVVRAERTSLQVMASVITLAARLGKTPVQSLVYPGFIGNAMFRHYIREALFLVEDGAKPAQVDGVLKDFGFAMGPFTVLDMTGLDVGLAEKRKSLTTRPADRRYADLTMHLCDQGRLGQKSGMGWYRYAPGDRTPHPDPALDAIVKDYATARGIVRRDIGRDEILERCVLSMINEGARLVDLGVALRPGDVDAVKTLGYGFPRDKGGPLYLADRIGPARMLDRVRHYHRVLGEDWSPAPLLVRLVEEGRTFESFVPQAAHAQ